MERNFINCISMMSGTSLDGIDACLVSIGQEFSVKILDSYSLDYPTSIREKLLNLANNNGDIKDVCFLNFVVGELFAQCANNLLKKTSLSPQSVDFISSHGQTIFHCPNPQTIGDITTRSTLQIGDISVISERTGIKTVGDFRTKDVAAGGLGAPLVPFADELLFGREVPRAIQNIGGISNVTVLDAAIETFAFDNGPGNMLIDYFVNKFFDLPFDKNGDIASKGQVDYSWLESLLEEDYYSLIPPKTTGRELFNQVYAEKILKNAPKNKYDVIATITNLTAKTIFDSYVNFVFPRVKVKEIVLGGGGAYNSIIKRYLSEYFKDVVIKTHEDFGIPNKLKEAVAFALLGYCTVKGLPNNMPSCTGASKKVVMGKISL